MKTSSTATNPATNPATGAASAADGGSSQTASEHAAQIESEVNDRARYAAALTVVRTAGNREQIEEALDMLGLLDVTRPGAARVRRPTSALNGPLTPRNRTGPAATGQAPYPTA